MRKKYNIGQANPMYGKRHSPDTLQKMRLRKEGSNNPLWQGDNVGLKQLHQWVTKRKPKPLLCQECKERHAFDLVSIGHVYKRDVTTWRWLCRRCHMIKEDRIHNLEKYQKTRREKYAVSGM